MAWASCDSDVRKVESERLKCVDKYAMWVWVREVMSAVDTEIPTDPATFLNMVKSAAASPCSLCGTV